MRIRDARTADIEALVEMRSALWPDSEENESRAEVGAILAGSPPGTLPLTVFVAESDGDLVGFVEVGLRSHADGCDPSRPCGFIEGWYVRPEATRAGVGRALIERAETWARDQGCVELASDTWSDNATSHAAHLALGFEVVDRCTNFRKPIEPMPGATDALPSAARPPGTVGGLYADDLARVHHEHFGNVARGAARFLLDRLTTVGISEGTIVELACGSGISGKILSEAGYDVVGVDASEAMLDLARDHAPDCTFAHGSLWNFPLPPCVAVTAIGEALCYAGDKDGFGREHRGGDDLGSGGLDANAPADAAGLLGESTLVRRLKEIHDSLEEGGFFLFDVAGPGRSGPEGRRNLRWEPGGGFVSLDERTNADATELVRTIDTFVPSGKLYRHRREIHRLSLFDPATVERALGNAGFRFERHDAYGSGDARDGWHVFLATA